MINKLTKKQEEKIPVYLKKWLDIGTNTEVLNRDKSKEVIEWAYEFAGFDKPKYFIYLDSPMACQIACNLIKNTKFDSQLDSQLAPQLNSQLSSQLYSQLRSQLYSKLGSQLDSQLSSQLSSQLYSQLRSQLYSKLGSQLFSQLYSQLDSQLRSQLYSQLNSQLISQLYSQLRSQLISQLYSQLQSQLDSQLYSQLYSQLSSQLHSQLSSQLISQIDSKLGSQKLEKFSDFKYSYWWIGYYGFYDFILNEIFPEKVKDFELLKKVSNFITEVQYFIPFKEIVFISERPKDVVFENQVLHNPSGPSLEYRDGFKLYSFEGVKLPDWVIETPKQDLDYSKVMGIQNVEQRYKSIKFLGLENFLDKLGYKVLDKKDEYELLLINIENKECEYLKMENPSTKEIHIEGIKPGIKTVDQALLWRVGFNNFSNFSFKA